MKWLDALTGRKKMVEAAGAMLDDEPGYRRLTGGDERPEIKLSTDRARELAVYVWDKNPLARQVIDLPVNIMSAEGVGLTSEDEAIQDALDVFWHDPINNMDIRLPQMMRELSLFGEQCWPVFVGANGRVRLGTLDPARIDGVILDPDNAAQPIGVKVKTDPGAPDSIYKVIIGEGDDTEMLARQAVNRRKEFNEGECFYWRVNHLSTEERGRSDLKQLIDWLDGYEYALFGELDRWDFMRAFIWDVTLKGATQEQVDNRLKEIKEPSPGSIRAHNESEEWKAVAPALQSGDTDALSRLFRNHILGGAAQPEHWFGGGGDVNRATAAEMDVPTFKTIAARQEMWGNILRSVARFVLAVGGHDPAAPVSVVWPELKSEDTSRFAAAFQQVVAGASIAVDRDMLSAQTARRVVASAAQLLGVDIDTAAEAESIAAAGGGEDVFGGVGGNERTPSV